MKWLTSIFSLLVLFSINSSAQIRQVACIDTIAEAVFMDNLDDVYILTPTNELLKYNAFGKLKWRYSNARFGKLNSVDVSDPMRIVLFYADFQQVVVLNNNLSEITNYSFARNGDLLVAAVAASNNNSFWIFDRGSNALIKLSSDFTAQTRSANLSQIFEEVINPKKLVATNEHVFLQQKDNQLLQFDRFGGFLRVLPIDSVADFRVMANLIYYEKKGSLIKYNPFTFERTEQLLPILGAVKQVAVGNKIIAVLTEKAVFLLSNN